ncbi:methyltransferase family protein [Paralcaligenes ureilyticus]|uniref:Methyltransferase family protein n=2 Tax=Paralcaligenes ureilyticus TaxID=627131 RepID=A0A4V2UZ72_9BURK|nr:methyltransferase family protein [Paralcaligenes ureilyticus]
MGSAGLIARAVQHRIGSDPQSQGQQPLRVIEIGAGDGTLMLRLAHRFAARWPAVHLSLLDRQNVVSSSTQNEFKRLGWTVEVLCVDVLDWAAAPPTQWDIALANLFVHHFDSSQITVLFESLARCTDWFMACEPRRGRVPLFASRLLGLTGASAVTRVDAVLSVKAGFSGAELSELWPHSSSQWAIQEGAAGLFSHAFIASREMG